MRGAIADDFLKDTAFQVFLLYDERIKFRWARER